VNGLNWMEGYPDETPIHRRTDNWYFAGSKRVTEQTYYRWKSKFGGMSVSEMHRLKELESENQRLMKLVAEKELHIDALKEVVIKY